jgi:hypothetical protein
MEKATPAVALGMLVGLGGLTWVIKRRNKMRKERVSATSGDREASS